MVACMHYSTCTHATTYGGLTAPCLLTPRRTFCTDVGHMAPRNPTYPTTTGRPPPSRPRGPSGQSCNPSSLRTPAFPAACHRSLCADSRTSRFSAPVSSSGCTVVPHALAVGVTGLLALHDHVVRVFMNTHFVAVVHAWLAMTSRGGASRAPTTPSSCSRRWPACCTCRTQREPEPDLDRSSQRDQWLLGELNVAAAPHLWPALPWGQRQLVVLPAARVHKPERTEHLAL